MRQVQAGGTTYDFSVAANGSFPIAAVGTYFRIITSSGSLTVRMNGTSSVLKNMIAGQGVQGQDFLSLELFNTTAAAITGTIFVGDGGFFDLNLSVTGGIAVRPEVSSGVYQATSALAANTAEQVLAPTSNTNGVLVDFMQSRNYPALGGYEVFITKASAPANTQDGTILTMSKLGFYNGTSNNDSEIYCEKSMYVPGGQGIYFMANALMVATLGNQRVCRYKIL